VEAFSLKAAFERNPVSIAAASNLDTAGAAAALDALPNESIYEGSRMAQPDEVWNYGRGDGMEKAICLLNIIRARVPQATSGIKGDGRQVWFSLTQGIQVRKRHKISRILPKTISLVRS